MKKWPFFLSFVFFMYSCAANKDDLNHLNWAVQYLPTAPSLRGLSAVSDREAWVSGSMGFCAFSQDGGTTWTRLEIPGIDSLDFRDVHAFPGGTAYLLSSGPGPLSVLFKTDNYGKHWRKIWTNPYASGFCSGMAFWDEHRGAIFSDPVDGKFRVFLTRDAGQTWKEVDLQNMPPAQKGEYAFAASGTCIFAWPRNNIAFVTGGSAARYFFSEDGGRFWEAVALPILKGSPSAGAFSVFMLPSGSGVIIGGDYRHPDRMENTFAFTENGGKLWQTESEKALPYQSCVISLGFWRENSWLTTGPRGTFFSADNGRNWKKVSSEGFHVLAVAPGGQRLWAAGPNGKVGTYILPERDSD